MLALHDTRTAIAIFSPSARLQSWPACAYSPLHPTTAAAFRRKCLQIPIHRRLQCNRLYQQYFHLPGLLLLYSPPTEMSKGTRVSLSQMPLHSFQLTSGVCQTNPCSLKVPMIPLVISLSVTPGQTAFTRMPSRSYKIFLDARNVPWTACFPVCDHVCQFVGLPVSRICVLDIYTNQEIPETH